MQGLVRRQNPIFADILFKKIPLSAKVNIRKAPSVLLAILALAASDAMAVRPFVTDDARIIDEGQIEAETWLETGYGGRTWSPAPAYNVMLGTSLNQWLEVIVGGAIGRDGEADQLAIANPAFQSKLLLNKAQIDSIMPGFALGAGATIDTGRGDLHHKGSNYYLTGMSSWRLYDDALMLHINYGARMDRERNGPQRITPYWGVGFDAQAFHPEVRIIGEAFAGDPLELNEPKYAGQFGVRWLPSDYINLDITFGLQPELDEQRRDTGRIDATGQIGLRMLFDAFTPGGKPGRADGADGLFPTP
ncbi:MAG: hypothetical protein Q7U38_10680 [Methylobacter sp.]|nr:hypothetical protein [Methylobacter sp.]MDP2099136.1 hypothetical protein [Methylobacter sp.]MDP2429962.1 hypothetical protein [Methylobacter sp.]MDP3054807.1 hypothetical protein [Methylobacter sp.]MDP3361209.1 hypothetical protein [Methylobacter sp.]